MNSRKVTEKSKATNIYDLKRGDSFIFDGDVQKKTYIYNSCKNRYARVVDDRKKLDTEEEWSFVSTESLVHKIDE